jgi:hypothetical protein
MVSTDVPSTEPLLYIIALEGHSKITVSLHMHSVNLKCSGKVASYNSQQASLSIKSNEAI